MELAEQVMSRPDAERLTERIRHAATSFVEAKEKLTRFIQQAQEGRAHEALGFRSWTEYVSQVFSDTPLMRLSRDERRELVGELSASGMSTRAIAPIVGADQKTIVNDRRAHEEISSPDSRPVQGVDGKTYTPRAKPEPADGDTVDLGPQDASSWEMNTAPSKGDATNVEGANISKRRKALTDQAQELGWEMRKIAERLAKLRQDDRFGRNKEEVTAHLRGHLQYTVEICYSLLDETNK